MSVMSMAERCDDVQTKAYSTLGRLLLSLIEVSSSSRCQGVPSRLSARLKPTLAERYAVPNNAVTMRGTTVPSSCTAVPKECYARF